MRIGNEEHGVFHERVVGFLARPGQLSEHRLGLGIVTPLECDRGLQELCLFDMLTCGEISQILVQRSVGIAGTGQGAVIGCKAERGIVSDLRVLAGLEQTLPDQDRLPFLIQFVVSLGLT